MTVKTFILTTFFWVSVTLLFADGTPTEKEIDSLLTEMVEKKGEEYVSAREKIVELEGASAILEKRVTAENWLSDNYKTAFCASVCLLYIRHRGLVEKCLNLQSLKPEVFLRNRAGIPFLKNELQAIGKESLPILIEVLTKTFDLYQFPPLPESEKSMTPQNTLLLQKKALKEGIIDVLGEFKDERAVKFLDEILKSEDDESLVHIAALSLGNIDTKSAVSALCTSLTQIEKDAILSTERKEKVECAILTGLGQSSSLDAVNMLVQTLKDENSENVKIAAAKALGTVAGKWKWEALGGTDTEKAIAVRKQSVNALIEVVTASSLELSKVSLKSLILIADEATLMPLREICEKCDNVELRKLCADAVEAIERRLKQ